MQSKKSLLSFALAFPLALAFQLQAGSCGDGARNRSATDTRGNVSPDRNAPANQSRTPRNAPPTRTDAVESAPAEGGNVRKDEKGMKHTDDDAAAASGATSHERKVDEGTWAGEHISLRVHADGAEVEYDCGHGTLGRLTLDGEGRFDVRGTHTPERGGPVRLGRATNSEPARYRGKVEGKSMMLGVTLTGTNEDLGEFTLTRGATANLVKCR
ncbi:MAG: hypothetical protein QOG00_3004 [Pyrinomonadaceae bacterium]|nr:hypothetical protein [Pyrinomonadaceae bacterium]